MTRAHISPTTGAITKPLLAARSDGEDLSKLQYPLGVTTKIDGIRCLKLDGHAVSRAFKPIPNDHIRTLIEQHLPDGMDMEITSGDTFQECSGNIMRKDGTPAFVVWIIDYVPAGLDEPYETRMSQALAWSTTLVAKGGGDDLKVAILTPVIAKDWDAVAELEAAALEAGHEGVMLRRLDAPYKCGRSTFKEGILVKVKRFSDQEARVVDVEEQMHNENERQRDAFGRTKRSTAQDGKTAAGVLGSLVVVGVGGDYDGVQFNVGTGFTAAQRVHLWQHRATLIGQLVTVKYFPTGTKDAPRFPTFKGFRDPRDLS
jgi:DNA ligase-1